ncbi:MAPEG family protein [Sphingomonas oligophenolica]|uniref:MAPEG family protein n=1 Tax=Sphingomonas oligophenolica TaxID=301154 RepID=A0A502CLR0_9SPHN|nr:MAPEG family protein [Sphingomonas oligophenolica]TPG13564.1 MAPEG family protein [Sphingomonas oligophenolica]
MTMLPVTLILAAGCALINLWLSFRIGAVRRAAKIFVGDGGDDRIIRRMRAQANFVENAPFVLALVGLIEFGVGSSIWLWIAVAVFLVGRICHAVGMDGWRAGRMIGTAVTMLLLLTLAIWAVVIAYGATRTAAMPIEPVDVSVPRG